MEYIMVNLKPESILIDENGFPKLHGLNEAKKF